MKYKDVLFLKTIRDFLTVYLPRQRKLSDNTVRSYRMSLNLFFEFLSEKHEIPLYKLSFEHLTTELVTEYMSWLQEERSNSDTTCNQRLMALRSFAKYASLTNPDNICIQVAVDNVPAKKCQSRIVSFFSEEALKALLDQPDTKKRNGIRSSCFMIVLYDTAARCQEMLDLRVGDIVFDDKNPYVFLTGKGNKTRTVPLMKRTVEHLKAYISLFHPEESRSKDDWLFYTVIHGEKHQMSPDTVAAFLKKYAEQAREKCDDIPNSVHPHQFRHTRAIFWYRNGVPLVLVAELLGHTDINTTQIYAYSDTKMKREAIDKAMSNAQQSDDSAGFDRWKGDEDLIKQLLNLL